MTFGGLIDALAGGEATVRTPEGETAGGVTFERRWTEALGGRLLRAQLRGAGADSFVLGCNAPMWGSLGLVHGMRVSNDVSRTWRRVTQVAEECFWRGWQHARLWANDPDCVALINRPGREQVGPGGGCPRPATELTADELSFHAAAVLATGGMVLSGDDLTRLPDEGWCTLERLAAGPGVAARFTDTRWELGRVATDGRSVLCALNWGDPARRRGSRPARRRADRLLDGRSHRNG